MSSRMNLIQLIECSGSTTEQGLHTKYVRYNYMLQGFC